MAKLCMSFAIMIEDAWLRDEYRAREQARQLALDVAAHVDPEALAEALGDERRASLFVKAVSRSMWTDWAPKLRNGARRLLGHAG